MLAKDVQLIASSLRKRVKRKEVVVETTGEVSVIDRAFMPFIAIAGVSPTKDELTNNPSNLEMDIMSPF